MAEVVMEDQKTARIDADVVVVGGGVVGLWTAYQLVNQGIPTLLFEQFPYPHTRGSSHGQSRIIRTLYAEEEYACMMPESYAKWRELEEKAGKTLFLRTGLLGVYGINDDLHTFQKVLENLQKYQPDHEVISGDMLESRFPGIVCGSNIRAVYDKGAGMLKADCCLEILREYFIKEGGVLHDCEGVIDIKPINQSLVEVTTKKRKYYSKSLVLTCGPYTNVILSKLGMQLPLQPMNAPVLYWKEESTENLYSSLSGFPNTSVLGLFYSIPSYEYPGQMKICHHAITNVDPESRDKLTANAKHEEEKRMKTLQQEIGQYFPFIDNSGPSIEEHCIITKTPDENYILDFHPKFKNIVIGAGFSGHGFKTSPAVGRMLANMAIGKQDAPSFFTLDRFKSSKL